MPEPVQMPWCNLPGCVHPGRHVDAASYQIVSENAEGALVVVHAA